MKTVYHHAKRHVERVRQGPHHVKRRVAFGSAALLTGLIAVIWLGGNVLSGAFAIKPGSFADVGNASIVTVDTKGVPSGLAGAAGAAGGEKSAAHIQIVDVSSSTKKAQQKPTTLSF